MYALVRNNGAFKLHTPLQIRSGIKAKSRLKMVWIRNTDQPIYMYADLRSRMRERGGGGADAGADPLLVATL
jgi:hypothetical protein